MRREDPDAYRRFGDPNLIPPSAIEQIARDKRNDRERVSGREVACYAVACALCTVVGACITLGAYISN